MRLRRLIPLGVAAFLLMGGAWSGALWTTEQGQPLAEGPINGVGRESSGADRPVATVAAKVGLANVAGQSGVASPVTLGFDEAAVLSETGELQLLAAGTELVLTSDQWTTLAETTLEAQAVRLAYEATIARRAAGGGDIVRLEIPMYAAAGDAMRSRFEARLGEKLGTDIAAEILVRIGARMEGHFGGFGVAEQTIEVTRGADRVTEVTRTVKYWNAIDGAARLTSRRETHFPAWEESAGAGWSALLAVAGG